MTRLTRFSALAAVALATACGNDSPSAPAPVPSVPGISALRVTGLLPELAQDAPAGTCEKRLRQSRSDAGTHYRVAIKYAR
jgi:hypothetical protein